MGHLNEEDLKKLVKDNLSHGVKIDIDQKLSLCQICLSEKQTQNSFSLSKRQSANLLDIVHSDVCGPMSSSSFSGARYFVSFIDDKSRWCQLYFLKNKSEVFQAFKKFKVFAELQTGRKIKSLQSDNGGEYCSNEFKSFLEECGIVRRLSSPHTPQQNGVAERKNRTLIDMARCLLKQSGAPITFWAEAVNTACYIRNRCPTKSLGGAIPYTSWTNKIPVLAHLQIFGTKAYVLNKSTKGKFDSRSKACIFLGNASDAKAYRMWDPDNGNIIISRDVKFTDEYGFETKSVFVDIQDSNASIEITFEPQTIEQVHEETNTNASPKQQPSRAKGCPRLIRTGKRGRPKKLYQTKEKLPANPDNELVNTEIVQESDENVEVTDEYESANSAFCIDPMNLSDALSTDEAESWLKATHDEYLVQLKNETWEIIERPTSKNVIGHRLVFKTKDNGTKKVRLVAKGCAQRPGIDFFDSSSPVVRPATVRLIAALATEMNLKMHQMDVIAAYLNGELSENVFMEIPENLLNFLNNYIASNNANSDMVKTAKRWVEAYRKFPNGVCAIKKALYGLRQSGLRWYEKLSNKLLETGLKPSKQDPCLFINNKDDRIILVAVYVDDLLIASNDSTWINVLKNTLSAAFDMKDQGIIKTFLGIDFVQNPDSGHVTMSQQNYIKTILKRFDMLKCKSSKTPIETKIDLRCYQTAEQSFMEKHPYQRLIGSLMYLAVSTRPDISFAVTYLSQFNTAYGVEHWTAAKRVLRYLQGTINFGISFQKTGEPMYGVADADWASDANGRKSYSGFAFILGGAAISWEARKQRIVTLSSTESEFMALTEATREAIYLKDILREIGLKSNTITIYNDSQSAQKLIKSVGHHSRTKHIDTRHHFIKDKLTEGVIKLEYMPTHEMPADVLTKGLNATKHFNCLQKLGVTNIC